jgi:hypothetical protein
MYAADFKQDLKGKTIESFQVTEDSHETEVTIMFTDGTGIHVLGGLRTTETESHRIQKDELYIRSAN